VQTNRNTLDFVKLNVRSRLQVVRELYRADSRPWIVAFSGGKDSTAALQLIWLALRDLSTGGAHKPVYVCYVDTGMEHPAYDSKVRATLSEIGEAAELQGLPMHVRMLEPELKNRYFVCVIGRGYAPPTHWFRWCTRNLRIKPMSNFIRTQISLSGEVVIVLGLRRTESGARSRVMDKYKSDRPFTGPYGGLARATAFTPIEDFGTEHVWQFLMQTPCPWGADNRGLVQLYAQAAGGECPSYSAGDRLAPSCGGSRFGCWTCTVVRKDRSGGSLAEVNEAYEMLVDFRDWLAEMRYDPRRRWRKRRNGRPGPGPLTIATRREAFERLLSIEAGSGCTLITPKEVHRIAELWAKDGGNGRGAIVRYETHLRESVRS